MCVTGGPNKPLVLEPIPHGAAVVTGNPRSLVVDQNCRLETIAVSRFQLIAAVGLREIGECKANTNVVVFGSGPVAIGCLLELQRMGCHEVTVVSTRSFLPGSLPPNARTCRSAPPRTADLAIDCTGAVSPALETAKKGGTVALLGTPSQQQIIDPLYVHRSGLQLLGMHELVPPAQVYRSLFSEVLAFVHEYSQSLKLESMCERWPGEDAPIVYDRLRKRHHPIAPIVILEW